MKDNRWQRAKEIFDEARRMAPDVRTSFIDTECAGDTELRAEVEMLLASYESNFLEENVLGAANLLIEPGLTNGQVIGRYKIGELIGTGGMGHVFRADDTELNRPVAFKVLHRDVADDQERVRRFIQEARAASALNHPNILTIYEIGSFEDARFIVSEFVDGETLRERMAKGLTSAESVDIMCQITAALQAAHTAGIVHRDIKPENIMLRQDGLVKVLDFGLAKLTENGRGDAETQRRGDQDELLIPASLRPGVSASQHVPVSPHTQPGLIMGTVAYMSPEQARGQAVDSRTDLWSLGVVFHEMLTGESPFKGESVTDLVTSIVKHDPASLDLTSISQELKPICTKALAKDKKARYQSAQDLLQDLQGEKKRMEYAIQQTPYITVSSTDELKTQLIRRRPTLSAEYIVTSVKRHKYATLFTAAMVVLVGIGFSVYKYNAAPQPDPADGVLPAITSGTTEKDLKLSRLATSGRVYDVAISPDGKFVAYATGDTILKNPIRLRDQTTGNEIELVAAPADGQYTGYNFSPDGKFFYYSHAPASGKGSIFRVAVSGGQPLQVAAATTGSGSVSPDGRFLFFERYVSDGGQKDDASDFVLADPDGTNQRVVIHEPTGKENWLECTGQPAWSADSKKVACERAYYNKAEGESHYKLVAIDINNGTEKELSTKKWDSFDGKAWLANGDLVVIAKPSTDQATAPLQLWQISPGAEPKQITNGTETFRRGLTATAKGDILAVNRFSRKVDLWALPQNDSSKARQITSSGELTNDGGVDSMPDGRIAFVSRASGNIDIWSMLADGSARKQLTKDAGENWVPRVSPDGRYIAFMSERGSPGYSQIYRMDADGGNVKQLATGGRGDGRAHSPAFSPDGKWVYFIKSQNGQQRIWKVPIEGGEPTTVWTPPAPGGIGGIEVARNGRLITASLVSVKDHADVTFHVIEPIGGKTISVVKTRLTTPQNGSFRWTPDSKSIAYNDMRNGIGNIWSISADGKGKERQLTSFTAPPPILRFAWSTDGKQLLVSRVVPTSDGILITNKGN